MGCGDAGMKAAEQVIPAGLLRLGGAMLGELLAADNGYRGPRVPCGQGHEAVFAGYRDKSFDIATGKFPGATQIVDLYHAREHLHSLTRSLEFMLLDRKDE
jgi:hypothetical protein